MKKMLSALLVLAGLGLSVFVMLYFGWLPGKTVPVLMYHHVTAADEADLALEVSRPVFERQMAYLHTRGYKVLTPEELLPYVEGKAKPHKEAVLTFDDGNADCYENALPVLEKFAFKAVFFIVPDWVGRPGFMTWDQIRDLQARGHVIGSHSMTHGFMTAIGLAKAKQEIYNSKRLLSEKLDTEITWFCYPAGRFNPEVQALVKEAGYAGAFTHAPGRAYSNTDRFAIKRIRVRETSDSDFKFWWRVAGYYLLFRERTAKRMK